MGPTKFCDAILNNVIFVRLPIDAGNEPPILFGGISNDKKCNSGNYRWNLEVIQLIHFVVIQYSKH